MIKKINAFRLLYKNRFESTLDIILQKNKNDRHFFKELTADFYFTLLDEEIKLMKELNKI